MVPQRNNLNGIAYHRHIKMNSMLLVYEATGKQLMHISNIPSVPLYASLLLLFLKLYYLEKEEKWEALMGTRWLPVVKLASLEVPDYCMRSDVHHLLSRPPPILHHRDNSL